MTKSVYLSFCLGALLSPYLLFCNPEGAKVVAGEASFHQKNPSTMHIEAGHGTVIEWQKFSIAEGETTRFIQPNAKSAVLNRVTGKEKSLLSGSLEANGKVYLINPHGILINKSGVIKTAGFFGSTHNLSDEEFLQQGEMAFKRVSNESLVNYGNIEAFDGDVALISSSVENHGSIRAPEGEVFLGSGGEVILRPFGDDRMHIRLSEDVDKSQNVGVHHKGAIEAIRATIKADGNLCALAINQEGTINATGVLYKDGQVFLVADQGTLHMTGSIASHNIDGSGGEVRLLGREVGLVQTASVDVSGPIKGGTVLIGGDYQGKNPDIPNAQGVYIGENASINASAISEGDGGKVILWGDQSTAFFGSIKAEGGSERGDGGFVEISSKGAFFPNGSVSTLAPQGKIGTLLLDPVDLTIKDNSGSNVNAAPAGTTYTFSGTPAIIDWTNLAFLLFSNAVTINTGGPANASFNGSGDISVDTNSVFPLFPNPLTLISPANVNIIGALQNTTLGGDLNIQASGNININSSINWGANLNFNAGNTVTFTGATLVLSNNNLTITTGSSFNVDAAQIQGIDAGPNLTLNIGGSANINSSGFFGLSITSSGTTNVNIAGDLNMNASGNPINIGASNNLTANIGGSLNMQNRAKLQSFGNALTLVGNSISMLNGASITASGSNTVAFDQSKGCNPGSNTFTISGSSSLSSGGTTTTPLYLYAPLFQSLKIQDPSTVTFNGVTAQTLALTGSSINEAIGICYNTTNTAAAMAAGYKGDPITIFYKNINSLQQAQALQTISLAGFTQPTSGSPAIQYITQNGLQLEYVMPYFKYFSFIRVLRPMPGAHTSLLDYLLFMAELEAAGETAGATF